MNADADEGGPADRPEPLTADLFRGPLPSGGRSTVWVTVDAEGTVRLDAADYGGDLEKYFGRDEHEWWVTVSAIHGHSLILALMKKLYAGDLDASRKFRELLTSEAIPFDFATY
jgi:hypothetical protein